MTTRVVEILAAVITWRNGAWFVQYQVGSVDGYAKVAESPSGPWVAGVSVENPREEINREFYRVSVVP